MGMSSRIVCVGFFFAKQACAMHNPTQDHNGNMLEVHDQDEGEEIAQFPSFLAGCKSGNFYAKGAKKCTGIQRLQCDQDGGCIGTLQGKPYKINCNHKHECVTDAWGGTLVRKYMSTTNHDGAVHWNNGCSWICDDKSPTFARTATGTGATATGTGAAAPSAEACAWKHCVFPAVNTRDRPMERFVGWPKEACKADAITKGYGADQHPAIKAKDNADSTVVVVNANVCDEKANECKEKGKGLDYFFNGKIVYDKCYDFKNVTTVTITPNAVLTECNKDLVTNATYQCNASQT